MSTSPSPPDRRAEKAAHLRRRLLHSASVCFAENGFKEVTMEEIAWAADTSKPSIYKHFAGKEELIDAVLQDAVESWSAETAARAEIESEPGAALAARIRASVRFASGNPILRKIMSQDRRTLLAGHSAHFRRAHAQSLSEAQRLLAEGVASGIFRADLDVPQTAVAFELVHFSLVEAALGLRDTEVGEPLLAATLEMLLGGIQGGAS